jgi:hypothetical protein
VRTRIVDGTPADAQVVVSKLGPTPDRTAVNVHVDCSWSSVDLPPLARGMYLVSVAPTDEFPPPAADLLEVPATQTFVPAG